MLYVVPMHNTPHSDDDLLFTAQVAELLGKDVSTVSRMVARGDLTPAVKAPGKRGAYLFRRSDVEALRVAS